MAATFGMFVWLVRYRAGAIAGHRALRNVRCAEGVSPLFRIPL
jgi:hypothetical protein